MTKETKLYWVYVIDLESQGSWTSQLKLLGRSLQEVLNQIAETTYRNWAITKAERTTWITDLQSVKGEPRTRTTEVG